MSHRTPAYVTCVILAAVILSIPQMMSGMSYLQYIRRGMPSALVSFACYSPLSHSPFWENKFCAMSYYGNNRRVLTQRDPETGISSDSNIEVALDRSHFQFAVYGDQLWLVGDQESFQVINGKIGIVPTNQYPESVPGSGLSGSGPPGSRPPMVPDSQRFLLYGELPASIENSNLGSGFTVASLHSNNWMTAHDVVLPDPNRSWIFGTTPISFRNVTSIECVSQKDRIHCFARTNERLLYREGLPLRPIGQFEREFTSETPSALKPANADFEINGWTLISESPAIGSQTTTGGILIEGRPAALIVDSLPTGHATGRVYRFDGKAWSLFETVNFPFGGVKFRTVSRDDGERSYIVMTTATGRAYVFSASAAGIKQTFVDPDRPINGFRQIQPFLAFPCLAMVLAAIQAVFTTGFMSASTHPDYGYGVQKVQLAAVLLRGVARAIDLALITGSTCIFGRILTHRFDWASFGEAVKLQVSHPTISQAMSLAMAIVLWLCFTCLAVVYIQGKWGITPGKWYCGLRVLQTTLKPCGFLRSLTREVTLAFESCNLLCWAPGIVAIALTDHRQRLGDWAADTIVIRRPRLP